MAPNHVKVIALHLFAYTLLFLAAHAVSSQPARPIGGPLESVVDPRAPAEFAGSQSCAGCHSAEHAAWTTSHHAAAMQVATDETVLGDFSGAVFEKDGIESRFFRRDGKFMVTTDGDDGKLADFEIKYTFGRYPLQQYLIPRPGGRLQALGIAWDARPASAGGMRWFHLYPDRTLRASDRLHWTGIDQNWNYQCAACHSTNLKKNYDQTTREFATTWSEISVGCEACHGPGTKHVAWARGAHDAHDADPLKGFAKQFDERKGVTWIREANPTARRSEMRTTAHEIEACAACHSRREQISDQPDVRFLDSFRPSLIEAGLYYVDGQQRDEVFTHGSFAQSRMHAAGVTCSDCHDPHSGTLRFSGNALCTQCHAASTFDTASHHHHEAGTNGTRCVSCHMPVTVYMGVDSRHDHSFRIPRPDLTATLGAPNACQACHMGKSASDLAAVIKTWFPNPKGGFQTFADIFDRADRGAPGAEASLLELLADPRQPAMARASALAKLAVTPKSRARIVEALRDQDASVRLAGVEALGRTYPGSILSHAAELLSDSSRAVRMEAARVLAGPKEKEKDFDDPTRALFDAALKDYVAAQEFNAERPEQQLNLAGLYMARGQIAAAREALDRALVIAPGFAPAFILLAELERAAGNEARAELRLREGLASSPGAAELSHALGLSLVRQKRHKEAVEALVGASNKAPDVSRFSYVAAIALKETGRSSEAVPLLEVALGRHPYDRDLLYLLATLKFEARDSTGTLKLISTLLELEPDNAEIAAIAAHLKRQAE